MGFYSTFLVSLGWEFYGNIVRSTGVYILAFTPLPSRKKSAKKMKKFRQGGILLAGQNIKYPWYSKSIKNHPCPTTVSNLVKYTYMYFIF